MPNSSTNPDSLPPIRATQLLRMGMSETRPVDRLIDRLEKRDGAEWLATALRAGPLAGDGDPLEFFTSRSTSLEALEAVKERCKDGVGGDGDRDERLGHVAGYFLAIAAALRDHNTPLTSRDPKELQGMLLDLAVAIPDDYRELLAQAAVGQD